MFERVSTRMCVCTCACMCARGVFGYCYDLFHRVQRGRFESGTAPLQGPPISCRLILGKTPNSMRCQQRIRRLMIPRYDRLCIGDDAWARNAKSKSERVHILAMHL